MKAKVVFASLFCCALAYAEVDLVTQAGERVKDLGTECKFVPVQVTVTAPGRDLRNARKLRDNCQVEVSASERLAQRLDAEMKVAAELKARAEQQESSPPVGAPPVVVPDAPQPEPPTVPTPESLRTSEAHSALLAKLDRARGELRRLDAQVENLERLYMPSETTESAAAKRVELKDGTIVSWGPLLGLARLSFSRRPDEPAHMRNLEPAFTTITDETVLGVQATWDLPGTPQRLPMKQNGKYFQLLSYGVAIMVQFNSHDKAQSSLSLGGVIGFLENTFGLGLGFDLYRGIPTRGASGKPGETTAHTGLASWALSPNGEVTTENIFVIVSLNLTKAVDAISGEGAQ